MRGERVGKEKRKEEGGEVRGERVGKEKGKKKAEK